MVAENGSDNVTFSLRLF